MTYLDDLETGETQYVSPQITELFGITPDEWKASPDAWLRTVHPEDRERAWAAFVEANESGEPFHAEYRVVAAGRRRALGGRPHRDPAGASTASGR